MGIGFGGVLHHTGPNTLHKTKNTFNNHQLGLQFLNLFLAGYGEMVMLIHI
jgi:hypothetical protein